MEEEGLPEFRRKQETSGSSRVSPAVASLAVVDPTEVLGQGPLVHNGRVVQPGELAVLLGSQGPGLGPGLGPGQGQGQSQELPHNGELVRAPSMVYETDPGRELARHQQTTQLQQRAQQRAQLYRKKGSEDDEDNEDRDVDDIMIEEAVVASFPSDSPLQPASRGKKGEKKKVTTAAKEVTSSSAVPSTTAVTDTATRKGAGRKHHRKLRTSTTTPLPTTVAVSATTHIPVAPTSPATRQNRGKARGKAKGRKKEAAHQVQDAEDDGSASDIEDLADDLEAKIKPRPRKQRRKRWA